MTWLKLSDDFADECARAGLSDAAFRTHVEGLIWTMRRETGGIIDRVAIRRALETEDPESAVKELAEAGMWAPLPDEQYLIRHHMKHQPEPDLIQARRDREAERQRRHRRRAAGLDPPVSRRDNTRDSPRDDTRDPGRVGAGRDGTGNLNPQRREETGALGPCANCGHREPLNNFGYCSDCET